MRLARMALLLAAGLTAAGGGRAADPPQPVAAKPAAGPFVVLVGVSEFTDPAIKPRPTADADARLVYDTLADPAYLASPDRVILLTSTPDAKRNERKATRENVLKALDEAVAKTGKGDLVVFGYFGRGASAGDRTALFTPETVFKERAKTALVGADLDKDMRAMQDRKLLLLLDVAFNGFDAGKETLAEPTLRDIFKPVFNQGEDEGLEQTPPTNKLIVLATTPAHPPLTKDKTGLFAATAVEALRGKADAEGYEPDGLVTADEFTDYLEKQITEQARTLGTTTAEKESVPFFSGRATSHFAVTTNPAVAGKVADRVKALAKLKDAGQVTAEAAEEGRQLLTRMPKLKSRQELRKAYQQLADGGLAPDKFAAERVAILEKLKVTPEQTEKYARTVLEAIDQVRRKYVREVSTGEWAALAVKGLYWRLDEPVPAEVTAALENAKGMSRTKVIELLQDVRSRLGVRDDIPDNKDVDKTIDGMCFELYLTYRDPYTSYFDSETLKKIENQLRGEFTGVGIQIRRDLVKDGLLVVSPIKGSPAYRAGVKAGDVITEIRREVDPQGDPLSADAPKVISTKGMKTEKALDIILGKPGVPVTLVVDREKPDGTTEKIPFTIRRSRVQVETVLGVKRTPTDDWTYMIDEENKIGYVCLSQFNPTSGKELKEVITKLQKAGMKGFVLDLRFNPGGRLDQAVDICDLFIDDGLIVSVRYRDRDREAKFFDKGFGSFTNFPMAVLVNGKSASASEIVSACMRDHERAVVVGERTYGKGSVQNLEEFEPTHGLLKMTTARYFPPKGVNIDKASTSGAAEADWGVRPDRGYEVKLTDEEERDLETFFRDREIIPRRDLAAKDKEKEQKAFKDRQLEKALDYVRSQVRATARKAG
ncbi:MAG: S41 family peptidase [Gemmataceae bacterium]